MQTPLKDTVRFIPALFKIGLATIGVCVFVRWLRSAHFFSCRRFFMKKKLWTLLASLLACSTLTFGVGACGDMGASSSNGNGSSTEQSSDSNSSTNQENSSGEESSSSEEGEQYSEGLEYTLLENDTYAVTGQGSCGGR